MNQPKFQVTTEVVNDCLRFVQDNDFIIHERPHLILGHNQWLVKCFHKVLDPDQPTITVKNRSMVIDETKIIEGRLAPVWHTTSKEVANEITIYRLWFLINAGSLTPSIELHIERVPLRQNWTPYQQTIINNTLKRKGYQNISQITHGMAVLVDYRKKIKLDSLDSIKEFENEIKEWLI